MTWKVWRPDINSRRDRYIFSNLIYLLKRVSWNWFLHICHLYVILAVPTVLYFVYVHGSLLWWFYELVLFEIVKLKLTISGFSVNCQHRFDLGWFGLTRCTRYRSTFISLACCRCSTSSRASVSLFWTRVAFRPPFWRCPELRRAVGRSPAFWRCQGRSTLYRWVILILYYWFFCGCVTIGHEREVVLLCTIFFTLSVICMIIGLLIDRFCEHVSYCEFVSVC